MNLYIKKIICIIAVTVQGIMPNNDTLSLLKIHNLRSDKLNKNRLSHGKKILSKRLNNKSLFLINGITDMASRLGCDQGMQIAVKKGLGKKSSKLISSACETKNRER